MRNAAVQKFWTGNFAKITERAGIPILRSEKGILANPTLNGQKRRKNLRGFSSAAGCIGYLRWFRR